MGPMKMPRLSAILSADMEPQAPQEAPTPAAAGAAAGPWSSAGGEQLSGTTARAGAAWSQAAARFDDRCTEVCEAAQGEPGGRHHEAITKALDGTASEVMA